MSAGNKLFGEFVKRFDYISVSLGTGVLISLGRKHFNASQEKKAIQPVLEERYAQWELLSELATNDRQLSKIEQKVRRSPEDSKGLVLQSELASLLRLPLSAEDESMQMLESILQMTNKADGDIKVDIK